MPPINTPNTQQEVLEQQMKEVQNNYIVAVQNLSVTNLESKKALVSSWLTRDKLINDFFTFSLITLGAAATILTAKSSLISSKSLFYVSLACLTITIIFSSFSRLYIDFKANRATQDILNNFNDTVSKIDVFRIDPANVENKTRMDESVKRTNEFYPVENWLIRYSQVVSACIFTSAFLLFVLSLVISVNIPKN
ncbi:MAG TPA: hypothetical protein VF401_02245 [Candidatus Saccharimonadales bacterium]